MTLFVSFCAALAAALIVINLVQTWAAYPQLPDRVALQFNWDGTPRSYWPRWTIWFVVVLQIVLAAGMAFSAYAIANHAPGVHGTLQGFAIFAVLFNALLWRVQRMLISGARENRLTMKGFLLFFAVWFALFLIDVFAIG
ncbi:MAG TPA: DUF1648 domain-containing protein [Candidatus Baltobacteraceae bacterium]|nr:DUF1648 domain-containing protein [Candidatus Baltobacteraceae bacterium]